MANRSLYREKEPAAPLNWRRGLFRLWILVSAAWMMGWLIYYAIIYTGGEAKPADLLVLPVVLFGPPIALLLFGIATRWAFRGFES
jgi:hypothetical protein